MALLKAKLYKIEEQKRRAEVEKQYDEKGEVAWGYQIRNYVLQPYTLVKDVRTDAADVAGAEGAGRRDRRVHQGVFRTESRKGTPQVKLSRGQGPCGGGPPGLPGFYTPADLEVRRHGPDP